MEQVKLESKILHPEVLPVTREAVTESLKGNRITLPYFTKYEYVTLVGVRAQQLQDGAKPLVSIDGMVTSDPRFVTKLAEKEILEKKLPFIVHRRMPSGESEYWSAMELSVIW
jgi:DNA-directed RNA polymerase I, II, and III subunit RPABC2